MSSAEQFPWVEPEDAPVAPAKQQPLTDSQIWELALATSSTQGGWESGWNVAFARAIEAAHGIGDKL